MADSLLQKEFKEKDIQRIRNLVNKNYGEKTVTQMGYRKIQEDHNEGDIWEENNKTWTIKNGIKVSISKLDLVKKSLQNPLACPCCNKAMVKKHLDSKMYSIHKKCFDCVIEMETKLRYEGKYEAYVADMMKRNMELFASEIENDMEDLLKELISKEQIVTENGEIEEWGGKKINISQIKEELETYIKQLRGE